MTDQKKHTWIPAELPHVPVPEGYRLRDVQLEMSLKPFFDNTPETRQQVCAELFHQWQALWRHADSISILLWIAEGSEILEYSGDEATEFEWARYQGAPNKHRWEMPKDSQPVDNPDHAGIGVNAAARDPERKGLHSRGYLYRPEPAVFTFGWLRGLVEDLKRIGGEITGRKILVGDAFDIGPEFAVSRFKYDWHREILSDGPVFKEQFISCEAILKGDDLAYAGYPEGIPDGLPIGKFLGCQSRCFLSDMGMDFLWLSNGFGFALEPWAMVGQVFDGVQFHGEQAAATAERVLRFWHDLRSELPMQYHLRTRGTNLATGIDLGSDASPLREIYQGGFGMDAPVNSPWAALDGDFGLELTGWMSHLVRHPEETFRFRFYTHDPWWLNSPWLDRYGRQPHDIYLPLAVSHLLPSGQVEIPRDIAFLSVDDSDGLMPRSVPNEVIAHILKAREFAPDAAGPLVWAYPFDAFHEMALQGGHPQIPFHVDAYMGSVVNEGVPLNTVVDFRALRQVADDNPDLAKGRIFLSAVPLPESEEESLLCDLLDHGWSFLLIGPLAAGSQVLSRLGLALEEPVEGDFELTFAASLGEEPGDRERRLRHTGLLSAGGLAEVASPVGESSALVLAKGSDVTRVVAAATQISADAPGQLLWTRGSLTTEEYNPERPSPIRGPILRPLDPTRFFSPGFLTRRLLRAAGWEMETTLAGRERRTPCHTLHRHRNAFVYSGFQRHALNVLRLRHPLGAPMLLGKQHWMRDGRTEISGEMAWHAEVRVFVEKGEPGITECRNLQPCMVGVNRRILVGGLNKAKLWILPDPDHLDTLKLLRKPYFPYFLGDFAEVRVQETPWGPAVSLENVDGELLIEW